MRVLALMAPLAACTSAQSAPVMPDASAVAFVVDVFASATSDADTADAPIARDALSARDAAFANPRCPGGVAMPYPEVAKLTDSAPLPPFRFVGESGTLDLRDRYAPCAAPPDLLVVRVMAAWSGHSRWHAAHTNALRRGTLGSRVRVLDLLVLDEQNRPAEPRALAPWRARYDAPPDALAVDPAYTLRPLYLGAARPPMVLYVDPRTMVPLLVLENPTQEEVAYGLASAAAIYAGERPSAMASPPLIDGLFSPDEWDFVRTMTPLGAPPPDPTNRYAGDARAAAFGARLFHDTGFSSNNAVSCETCHAAARDFADGLPTGMGLRRTDRNTPSVRVAPWLRWQFWDGRADSLWSQALGPVENPSEMGGSRLGVAHRIASQYRALYEPIFGPLPRLDDAASFPARGGPGDPAWEAMSEVDRDAVNRVFSNFGKAIAAYERILAPPATAFDRYLAGDLTAMTPRARTGLRRFLTAGCAQCHFGPALSNDSFHNVGMATGRVDGVPDQGRYVGVRPLLASPFRADGLYSDDRSVAAHLDGLARTDLMEGMFRTPTLRNVARTGPWGHGGTFTTLESVVQHYAQVAGGQFREPTTAGTPDPHLVGFHRDSETAAAIADVLRAMSE